MGTRFASEFCHLYSGKPENQKASSRQGKVGIFWIYWKSWEICAQKTAKLREFKAIFVLGKWKKILESANFVNQKQWGPCIWISIRFYVVIAQLYMWMSTKDLLYLFVHWTNWMNAVSWAVEFYTEWCMILSFPVHTYKGVWIKQVSLTDVPWP